METSTNATQPVKDIFVANEIGRLRKLLIHSPDGGIGKIIPSKFNAWLYDDTVQLIRMQKEYDQYVKILLWFLDPEVIRGYEKDENRDRQDFFKPTSPSFHNSERVVEVQRLMANILKDKDVRTRMIVAVSAFEGLNREIQEELEQMEPEDLAKTFISGFISYEPEGEEYRRKSSRKKNQKKMKFIFPPVPNFVFTRDIGITIKDHVLVSKLAMPARKRESLLMKYVTYYGLLKDNRKRIIEISEESDFFLEDEDVQKYKRISIEGGDIMMISPRHLIVGCSERTTASAVDAIIHRIFSIGWEADGRRSIDVNPEGAEPSLGIEKISVVKIPQERTVMHIDTIFTQVARHAWVMFGEYSDIHKRKRGEEKVDFSRAFSDAPEEHTTVVMQYRKPADIPYKKNGEGITEETLPGLETLLHRISIEDFGVHPDDVRVVYSAGGSDNFPFDEREQWTDSCNLLCLKEGVVVGYDRNERTAAEFENVLDFDVITAEELLKRFENEELMPQDVQNTLILLPSTELSRARGGSHCMSMPLLRDAGI
ncbi:MAG: arginine deiminase family protein [Bacteroidia bacterium]